MSATDFKFGSLEAPLTGDITNSSLQDIDGPIFHLLGLLEAAIRRHLEARYNAEVLLCRNTYPANIINYTAPYDASKYVLEVLSKLPILSMYRQRETLNNVSVVYYQSKASVLISYVMPPMNAEQAERLNPFRAAITKVIQNAISVGRDPNYLGGQCIYPLAGISSVKVLQSSFGDLGLIDETSAAMYPTLLVELEVVEIEGVNPGAVQNPILTGIDTDMNNHQENEVDLTLVQDSFDVNNQE